MKYKAFILLIVVAVVLGIWGLLPKPKKAPTNQYTEVVSITTGQLQGFVQDGLNVYLGIPYAKPPTGSLRFKASQPLPKWKGVFTAYAYGSVCPQVYDPIELNPGEKVNNENCLTLNIWAPPSGGAKKAVMVFIHGGGFVEGASKERLYDGAAIVNNGDVIYVNFNYRLGILGFMDFSVIGGSEYADSANNGLNDQLLALQWVQDNISAFGGDPQNVTIFGESAGGGSVLALMGIDNPQHFFKRAIVMSGSPLHSAAESDSLAKLIRDDSGIKIPFLWKNMPTVGITYIQDQVSKAAGAPMSDLLFAPTYSENNIMKHSPLEAAHQGMTNGIDLMIGTMANELSYWSFYDTKTDHICDQTITDNLILTINPGLATKVKQLYDLYQQNPERSSFSEGEIILVMEGDLVFRVPAIQLAAAQAKNANTYVYEMDYPINLPAFPCQNNRSPHGSELPFVFGKINEPSGTDFIGLSRDAHDSSTRELLMNQMMSAWTNFAKTGNPNGDAIPEWPLFTPEAQPIMRFGMSTKIDNAPFLQEYLAMAEFMKTFNLFDILK